jgi:replicative DNA helicase
MSARVLPHRPEAENAILGGIILQGRDAYAEIAALLEPKDFYQPRAEAVFAAMGRVDARGEPIDVITIEAELRHANVLELVGGIEGLARLDRFATAHNIKAHAELVREAAQIRNLVIATREIADDGMGEIDDAPDFLSRAEAKVLAVNAGRRVGGPRHVSQAIPQVFKSITDRQRNEGQLTGVATGYHAIDEMTAGLQPSDLIILAARPSMGKTAFALNIASYAAISTQAHAVTINKVASEFGGRLGDAYQALVERGQVRRRTPVLFFSLEMAEAQLVERVLCSEARVDAQVVRRGGRLMESDFRGIISAADRMVNHSDLYIDDRPALSITEIKSTSRLWSRGCEPVDPANPAGPLNGMVLLDYMQLAKAPGITSREQEISAISQGLKALAKELKMPVIALSQLNRKVDDRPDHRPQMADLRESGAIEQDADVVMFVYREERYLAADASEDRRREVEGRAEIIIGKQRNGPVGTVHLTFTKKHTRFENPAHEYEAGGGAG